MVDAQTLDIQIPPEFRCFRGMFWVVPNTFSGLWTFIGKDKCLLNYLWPPLFRCTFFQNMEATSVFVCARKNLCRFAEDLEKK